MRAWEGDWRRGSWRQRQDCGLAESAAGRAVFRARLFEGEVLWRFRERMVEGYVRGSRTDGGERRRCCEGGQCERRWWDRDCDEEGRLMKVWRVRCWWGIGWGVRLGWMGSDRCM